MITIEIPGRVPGTLWEALKARLLEEEGVVETPCGTVVGPEGARHPVTISPQGKIVKHTQLPRELQDARPGSRVNFRFVTGTFPVTDNLAIAAKLEETTVSSGLALVGQAIYVGAGEASSHDVCPWCGADNGAPDEPSGRQGFDCYQCGGN